MIIGHVNTGTFDWIAIGETEEQVAQALADAYAAHVREYGDRVDFQLMRELLETGGVNFAPIEIGVALRDLAPVT
jgi:hypothetical protein